MIKKEYFVYYYNELTEKKIKKIIKKNNLTREFEIATNNLKINPNYGNKIQRRLWPDKYKKDKEIDNLWRYELSRKNPGWRIIYTVTDEKSKNKIKILSVLIDVLNHHRYDRMFNY